MTIRVDNTSGEAVPGCDQKLLETLIQQADEALYAAKANGRNQVRLSGSVVSITRTE